MSIEAISQTLASIIVGLLLGALSGLALVASAYATYRWPVVMSLIGVAVAFGLVWLKYRHEITQRDRTIHRLHVQMDVLDGERDQLYRTLEMYATHEKDMPS